MRYAAFVFLCLFAGCQAKQSGSPRQTTMSYAEVQHFGPMIYAAMDEESPDPETYRTALFTEKANGRRGLLRALGLGEVREIDSAWQEFLKTHPDKTEDALLAAFASASIMDEPLEPHSRQVDLDLGFSEDTEHPFGIVALFNQRNGSWRHIATFACACGLGDSIDPLVEPKHRARYHDLVVGTASGEPNVGRGYLFHETHFRMKNGALRPLIDFDEMRVQCPGAISGGPTCTVWDTRLEKEMLADKQGATQPGFALVTVSGHPSTCETCVPMLHNPTCIAYVWEEVQFRYVPTEMSAIKCGEPLRNSAAKQMDAKSSRPTTK